MNHFSQQQLDKIFSLIREVEKLTDVEKLFLYLHLPCGKSELIEGGKSRSNNRLRLQNTSTLATKHQLTSSSSTSQPSSPLSASLTLPATISDFQKQLEQMPKRPDQETTQTYTWILSHLEVDPNVSLPKQEVYEEYKSFCQMNQFEPLCVADFGKAMKYAFPCIKPRRLGQRGNSRYCYSGLRKKYKLESPNLPNMDSSDNDKKNSNLINMDTTTTSSTTIATLSTIDNKQATSLINNNDIISVSSKINTSCLVHAPLAPSDRIGMHAGCAHQKSSDIAPTAITVIIPSNITCAYPSSSASIATTLKAAPAIASAPSSTATSATVSAQYNENNQYNNNDNDNTNQQRLLHQSSTFHNSDLHTISQRDSLTTPNNFENIYNSNNSNSTMNPGDFNANPRVSQNRSSIMQQQQQGLASRSSFSSPLSQSSYQPRQAIVSQASFDQGTSMVGATNYNICDSMRPGTPDDDDYCHNYFYINNYQHQQDNCINNDTSIQQQRQDHCIENNNIININYASNFRCQQNFIHQTIQSQQQHQQQSHQHQHQHQHQNHHHHQHHNNNNNQNQPNDNNIDDNNNQQQYHQHQHQQQQRQHHVTTPTGSSVNADPALSNGGSGPGYNNNNANGNDVNYVNAATHDANKFTYNNFVPKQEPDDSISFKQTNQQQIAQQHVIVNQATPLSMFTLDSCVSSPFQSPASTPYPSYMIVPTTPTYERPTDNFTGQQDSILSSATSTQNHYMTT